MKKETIFVPKFQLAEYRGLYVDNFKKILGDTKQENSLIFWAKRHRFNALSLYMSDILDCGIDSPARIHLAAFIKKAHLSGITQITGVASHAKWFATSEPELDFLTMETYNAQHKDSIELINAFQLEDEWTHHNPSRNFKEFERKLEKINQSTGRQNNKVISEVYLSTFGNWRPGNRAERILEQTDRILLADYYTSPSLTYLYSKLKTIAIAAEKKGKPVELILIFSTEADHEGMYFSKYAFEYAFYDFLRQWQRLDTRYYIPKLMQKNIKIIGYQIFTYSSARKIRD